MAAQQSTREERWRQGDSGGRSWCRSHQACAALPPGLQRPTLPSQCRRRVMQAARERHLSGQVTQYAGRQWAQRDGRDGNKHKSSTSCTVSACLSERYSRH